MKQKRCSIMRRGVFVGCPKDTQQDAATGVDSRIAGEGE
jgi:hypothetical protein